MEQKGMRFAAEVLIATLLGCAAHGSEMPSPAKEALITILQGDMAGDSKARIDNSLYLGGWKSSPDDCTCIGKRCSCDGFVPGHYSVETDPIIIVSSWTILGTSLEDGGRDITFIVRFHVLARTEGYGFPSRVWPRGREIRPLSSPQDEIVKYHERKEADGWKVVNPPIPRVGLTSISAAIVKEKEHFWATDVDRFWSRRNGVSGLGPVKDWVTSQLNALRACGTKF